MKRLKRLCNRYNPRRTYIQMDDAMIAWMSQLGYLELYRGEWFFTETGIDAIKEGIKVANIRARV